MLTVSRMTAVLGTTAYALCAPRNEPGMWVNWVINLLEKAGNGFQQGRYLVMEVGTHVPAYRSETMTARKTQQLCRLMSALSTPITKKTLKMSNIVSDWNYLLQILLHKFLEGILQMNFCT